MENPYQNKISNKAETELSEEVPEFLPASIETAANIIYLSIGIGVLNWLIMSTDPMIRTFTSPLRILTGIISFGLLTLMAYFIKSGKKWARTVFLIVFLLGMIFYPFAVGELFDYNIFHGLLSLVVTGLQIYALSLLFRGEANRWYRTQ